MSGSGDRAGDAPPLPTVLGDAHRAAQPGDTLVAENHPLAAARLCDAVRRALPGTTLHMASALPQARLMLTTVRPTLVLFDLNLADASLRDLIDEARTRTSEIRIIVVAGHGNDDRLLPALRAGAAGFLIKHDAIDEIAAQLRNALDGVLALSPTLARQLILHVDRGREALLSGPEVEFLSWIAAGDTPVQAARRMGLQRDPAQQMVRRVYRALQLPGDAPVMVDPGH